MIELILLMTGHTLADYFLQDSDMIRDKREYGLNTAVFHSGIHAAFTFIVLTFFVNSWFAIFLAIGNGLVHYHIDWAKAQIDYKYSLDPDSQGFWMLHGTDQFAHFLTLALIVSAI